MTPSTAPINAEEQPEPESGKEHDDANKERPNTVTDNFIKKSFKEHPQRFSAFFAGCALAVSTIALFFSYVQMGNSKLSAEAAKHAVKNAAESIALAEKSMRISNRPYMIVNGVPPVSFENWNKITVTIKIKNFGKTPAMRTRILAQINCFPSNFVENFPLQESIDTVKTSVDIGTEMPIHIELKNHKEFTQDEILQLNSKRIFLFAYGIIEYTDIFNDSLRTRFNFKWNGEKFEVHPKYNDIK